MVDNKVICKECRKGPLPLSDRCTNGLCITCHAKCCTPGGQTGPGHNYVPGGVTKR
jgi:hypothetical protein